MMLLNSCVTKKEISGLILLVFLLSGCATNQQLGVIKSLIGDENMQSASDGAHIDEIDLDSDGQQEFVATYPAGAHGSWAQVFKFVDGKPLSIFEGFSNTPNTEFRVIEDAPTIILEQSDYEPDYVSGHRYKEFYRWDGKAFTFARKQDSVAEQISKAADLSGN